MRIFTGKHGIMTWDATSMHREQEVATFWRLCLVRFAHDVEYALILILVAFAIVGVVESADALTKTLGHTVQRLDAAGPK